MSKYDVIVIGAGNAGLTSALRLVKSGKKVLVCESNTVPGGFATSFLRGRFEFEASLHELCNFGNVDNKGEVYKLFEDLEIVDKIQFVDVPEAYHVYSKDTNEDFLMPFGVDNYIEKMEEYVPGSKESLEQFFLLSEECKNALSCLKQSNGNIDQEKFEKEFPNFMKVADSSVEKVLNALDMPKKAQNILTTYWTYLGSPINTLSFIHFSSMVYSYITLGAQIPKKSSHEISLAIAEEIERLGGEIKYLSTVKEIILENDKVSGVILSNGKKYYADYIVSNISPNTVYGKLINENNVPKEALKLINSRILGPKCFSIYLALNQSAKDIGLNDYSYFIYNTLESNKEYENMNNINNSSSVAIVINNVNPSFSPKGTCVMNFTSLFYGDDFAKNVTEENYFKIKEIIADNIINTFEDTTGILIKQYIEEIEIASPVTFARFGSHPDGVIYGYKATGLDNLLPRLLNKSNENYISNLKFCGGFDAMLAGYSSTYLSGEMAAKEILKNLKEEDINE